MAVPWRSQGRSKPWGVSAPTTPTPRPGLPETAGYRLKRKLLGKPLVTEQLSGERLNKTVALGVLSPDCISSTAYGSEEMLTILVPAVGAAAFSLLMPVTIAIIVVLFFVTLSYREVVTTYTKATTKTFSQWHYGQITEDLTALKNSSGWSSRAATITLPIGSQGAAKTITWDGCIEERHTVQATSYNPIPSGANDLDVDTVPSASDANSLWAPALQPALFMRNIVNSYGQATTSDTSTTTDYYPNISYTCPTAAQKLQTWSSVSAFDNYVDSLTASGNTYHDIGMLWGARLMSPTGIFASENALAGNGGTINRNMIFMTDGDSTSSPCDYNAYGMPWWDQRQSTDVGPASQCGSNRQALIDQINMRYAALCTVVKNKGINLYVISYGNGSSTTTEQRLSDCASPGSYYKAIDPTALQTAFTAIAAKITMLRLTQ